MSSQKDKGLVIKKICRRHINDTIHVLISHIGRLVFPIQQEHSIYKIVIEFSSPKKPLQQE